MNVASVTPEQLQTLITAVVAMLLMNAGSLISGAFRAYFVWRKMQQDIKVAHDRLRSHDRRISTLESEREE